MKFTIIWNIQQRLQPTTGEQIHYLTTISGDEEWLIIKAKGAGLPEEKPSNILCLTGCKCSSMLDVNIASYRSLSQEQILISL